MVVQAGTDWRWQFLVLVGLLAFVASVPGCWLLQEEQEGPSKTSKTRIGETKVRVSADMMERRLEQFSRWHALRIQTAANQIADRARDNQTRKKTIFWKIYAIPNCRSLAYQEDSSRGLIDTWAFCMQMSRFFERGHGRDTFGEDTRIALEASRDLERDIRAVAAEAIPPVEMPKVEKALQDFVEEHPIGGPLSQESTSDNLLHASTTGTLNWVLDTTLLPFRSIGAMDQTARAIHEVADATEEMTIVANYLPEQTRWHLKLLAYDLEDMASVSSALSSFESLSHTAARLNETAERYPKQIQELVSETLEQVEENRQGLQETLKEARETLTQLEKDLVPVAETTDRLAKAGEAWKKAVQTLWDMIRDLSGPEEPEGVAPEESEPFDIKDYARTAEGLASAGAELQKAVAEIKTLLASREIDSTLELSTRQVKSVASHVTWMGGLLIVIFFASALLYRFTVKRLVRKGN